MEDFDYNKIHVTRHNTVLHYADNNKNLGVLRWERTSLSDLTEYEFVAGYNFSPKIFCSNIAKDFSKNTENETVFLISNGHDSFNIYVFVNPKNNKQIFDDLKKYNCKIAKYEYEEYDIVVVIETLKEMSLAAITGFTNMYINTHSNCWNSKLQTNIIMEKDLRQCYLTYLHKK